MWMGIKYLCLHNYDGSHIFGLMPLQLVCVLAILIVHARLLPTLAVTTVYYCETGNNVQVPPRFIKVIRGQI